MNGHQGVQSTRKECSTDKCVGGGVFFFILDQKIITVYYGACNICKMYVNNSKKVGRRETEEISLLVSHTSLK